MLSPISFAPSRFLDPIRNAFKNNIKETRPKKIESSLDEGFRLLRDLTRKVDALERQVYSTQSKATTNGITISVSSMELRQPNLHGKKNPFVYSVCIANNTHKEGSQKTVQLLKRHWIIRDSLGHIQEVKGDGVVGNQPILRPSESHNYSSHTMIDSYIGTMEGSYRFIDLTSGEEFEAKIAPFGLLMSKPFAKIKRPSASFASSVGAATAFAPIDVLNNNQQQLTSVAVVEGVNSSNISSISESIQPSATTISSSSVSAAAVAVSPDVSTTSASAANHSPSSLSNQSSPETSIFAETNSSGGSNAIGSQLPHQRGEVLPTTEDADIERL